MPGVMTRCEWAGAHPLMQRYHDDEWGVPQHEDRALFELLVLEGMQAGLSWLTVLKKRAAYQEAFENFEPSRVARYGTRKIHQLLGNAGIIRNRLKILAAIRNAQGVLALQERHGSVDAFVWQFVDHRPVRNHWKRLKDIPCHSPESAQMSRALLQQGFAFVGPTICYAFMQATGMVNDHVIGCFRHREICHDVRGGRAHRR